MPFNILFDRPDIVGPWVYQRTGGVFLPQISQCIGQLDSNGNVVAGVVFEGYNGATMKSHIAVEAGHSLNRQMLWAIGRYAFEEMKVKKLIGIVDSTNEKALKLDKKFGFVEECRIAGGTPDGDMVILSLSPENYRYKGLTADDIIKRI